MTTLALGFIVGIGVGIFLCDWMLSEAQSVLRQAKELSDDAVRLVGLEAQTRARQGEPS